MNCAQVKEQLIDFLYGELSSETQGSFTDHLNGCPACQAEVASYERTLGSARVALSGPLLEEAPARVHLAVIEAAKAAAKQATSVKAKVPTPRAELGFFARLWRTPWFLPAFGAASVATVVFLVRVLKNPEVLPGQRPHSIEERSLGTPEPVPAPEPVAAAKPAPAVEVKTDSNDDESKQAVSAGKAHKRAGRGEMERPQATALGAALKRKAPAATQGLDGSRLNEGQAGAGSGAPGRFAEPPPPRPAGAKASKDIDDLMGGFRNTESIQRRAQPMVAPAASKAKHTSSDEDRFDGPTEKAALPAKKAPQNNSAATMAKSVTHSAARSAGAPEGAAAPAPAYAPAAAPTPKVKRDYPAQSAASGPAPSAPPAVMNKKGRYVDEESEDSSKETYDDLAKDMKAKSGDKARPSLDESVRKAERLYASQDWNASAAAYRDLLNRFPGHKDAPRWRDRMNESSAAYQRALEAKRKKVPTDDPLSGSMK